MTATKLKRCLVLLFLSSVAACTTVGPAYKPPPPAPPGQATVILMRGSVSYGGAYRTKFAINHRQVVALYDKGYTYVYLRPGIYHFSVHDLDHSDHLKFNMAVQAGGTYYIRYTQYYYFGHHEVRNILRALFPGAGRSLASECYYKKAHTVEISPLPSGPAAVEGPAYDEERVPVHINVVTPPFPILQRAPSLHPVAPTR